MLSNGFEHLCGLVRERVWGEQIAPTGGKLTLSAACRAAWVSLCAVKPNVHPIRCIITGPPHAMQAKPISFWGERIGVQEARVFKRVVQKK